ncbi:MAG: M56 family metallopeptidase [Pyrinomonadaceae bacterium]|nr:M56 family metallopeptidase [Pyrinomonadaceae bacterium]
MERISYTVLTFLLNALWQITAVYVVTALFARLARNAPAKYVHLLWVLALLLSLGLPLWSLASFGRGAVAGPTADMTEAAGEGATFVPDAWSKVTAARLPSFIISQNASVSYAPLLTVALTCCYLWLVLRRLWALRQGLRATKELQHTAFKRELSPLLTVTFERCRAAFKAKHVPVLCSPRAATPFTAGARRSVIVLPESLFEEGSPDVLNSVVGHEMAHVRRYDFLLNLVYTLLALPISFHPLTALIKRRINETRELACDEMVVSVGRLVTAAAYARSLVRLAGALAPAARPGYSLGVFDADILEERIMRLIHQAPRASARLGKMLTLVASLCLAATGLAASSFSLHAVSSDVSAERSIVGVWQGKFPDCADAGCPPALDLTVKADGSELSGLAIFYVVINGDDGPKVKDKVEASLLDARFDGTTLSFKVKTKSGGALSFEMKLVADNECELRNLSVDDSSVFRMLKKESVGAVSVPSAPEVQQGANHSAAHKEPIAGDWTMKFGDENAATVENVPGFTLTFKSEGGKLMGTAARGEGAERVEWPLIEPQFDGETLSFKVNNGDEILAGELKPVAGVFKGLWKSTETKQSGKLSLTRKD